MNRFWKLIRFYLKYILYVLITVQDRDNYNKGIRKGYHCTHSHDDSYFLYGSARMYYYDRTKNPFKEYLTYKQYKEMYYPFKLKAEAHENRESRDRR